MQICEPIAPIRNTDPLSGLMLHILLLIAVLFAAPFLAGCRHDDPPAAQVGAATNSSLTLSRSSLADGKVPSEFTCDGTDSSPALAWSAAPSATISFALMITDPDAPGGTFTHWVLYNLPANSGGIAANITKQGQLPDGSRQGLNDFGKIGYGGPCPPRGLTHRDFFDIFALDRNLNVPARS